MEAKKARKTNANVRKTNKIIESRRKLDTKTKSLIKKIGRHKNGEKDKITGQEKMEK